MVESNTTSRIANDRLIMTIRVINDVQFIEPVLANITGVAERFNMPQKEIRKLCIAVEEAIANLITYAFDRKEDAWFDISVQISGMDFIIAIQDKGKPFDFSSLTFDNEHTEGLGVVMMQALTDKVEFLNKGGEGREQRLVKHLVSLPVYQQREESVPVQMPEQIEFDIHPLREHEALEVAQCIYDEFGYTYVSELIYYPQQFYDACQRGEIYSLVATAPDGEVAGHLAIMISKEFPGLAEMGIGVVKRKFRKYSIMGRLTDEIKRTAAEQLNLNAYFAQAVAYHTITQKLSLRQGMTACGFTFHYANDKFSTTFEDGRECSCNVATAMKPFIFFDRTLYVPDEVEHVVKPVLSEMSLTRVYLKGEEPTAGTETKAFLSISKRTRFAKYVINSAGNNFEKHLRNAMITVKREKCVVVEACINLTHPTAPACYDILKKHNFFFVGLMPQGENGDYLMMQNLLDAVIDYDGEIKTIEPFTSLLDEIRKLDPNEK